MFLPRGCNRAAAHNRVLEEPAMAKAKTLVGLDMHATKIVAAVLDAETGQLQTFSMSGESATAAGFCAGLPRRVRVAYEAGPTGYGLARDHCKRGVECVVAAPSKIPRASGDRVKTDRRDAEHLVRLLLAGKLHPVRVPGDEEKALRDLVRAREAVRVDLMRCRHRLSKLLLRHGIRFDDGRAWTDRHRAWLATITLDWPAAQARLVLRAYEEPSVAHGSCRRTRVPVTARGRSSRGGRAVRQGGEPEQLRPAERSEKPGSAARQPPPSAQAAGGLRCPAR